MVPEVALRPARAEDRGLLLAVYASTRARELAAVPWSNEQKAVFVAQQYEAQDRHYRTYENASFDVVLVDGEPAGRLLVARWPQEIRIMDIALLPQARGRGVGGRLITQLLDEAAGDGRAVSVHVEAENPAKRLYARLGFTLAEAVPGGIYERWEARPPSAAGRRPGAR